MDRENQHKVPFVDALEDYCRCHMVPFHTPGHKLGCGASVYQKELFGSALDRDLGLMYALDDLFRPEGPLREAMQLAADLYGAGRTFFSVNGTTACVEAMILAVCRRGDEIILPREAHRSVMNGLVLSGAVPVYMESRFAAVQQISLGPDLDGLKRAVKAHPGARAVLVTYPTYDGVAIQLEEMVRYAHAQGLYVLVDEAHGAHLPFQAAFPKEALVCGADCVAQSTHKLAGSLTQTSMLHCARAFPLTDKIAAAMALVQSTSPQYWFLASLDSARRQLALDGERLTGRALALARQLRHELNLISGICSFGREIMDYSTVGGFDETKITIDFSGLGLDGREAERLLRRERVEVEMTAGSHVLALITIGDSEASTAALLKACRRIASSHSVCAVERSTEPPLPIPQVCVSPQEAWNAEVETVPLTQALGRVSAEAISFYPPGIPVVGLGEKITTACLEYIARKMTAGYRPNGAAGGLLPTVRVLCL